MIGSRPNCTRQLIRKALSAVGSVVATGVAPMRGTCPLVVGRALAAVPHFWRCLLASTLGRARFLFATLGTLRPDLVNSTAILAPYYEETIVFCSSALLPALFCGSFISRNNRLVPEAIHFHRLSSLCFQPLPSVDESLLFFQFISASQRNS
jgi:hypothetical protein